MSQKKLIELIGEIQIADRGTYKFLFKKLTKLVFNDFYNSEPIPEKGFLVNKIKKYYSDNKDIKILDHGCGAGSTIFYLIGLGYHNIIGYDVSLKLKDYYQKYNEFINYSLNTNIMYFNIYDGINLPEEPHSIDVINSQAVMEHLDNYTYDKYLSEQVRVLRQNSIGIHIIPQRLQFFDSHNRILLVHWLPRILAILIYKLIKTYNPDINLHLRTTIFHLKKLKKFYGSTINCSLQYYMNKNIKIDDLMDGKKKRGFIFRICNFPVLKLFLPYILQYTFMHVSLSRKIRS